MQAGLLCRHPFAADIAKENVPAQHWDTPVFWRMNYLLTGIWVGIFFIMTVSYLVRCMLHMRCSDRWCLNIACMHGQANICSWPHNGHILQIVAVTYANGKHHNGLFIAFNYVVPLGVLFAGLMFSKWYAGS